MVGKKDNKTTVHLLQSFVETVFSINKQIVKGAVFRLTFCAQ